MGSLAPAELLVGQLAKVQKKYWKKYWEIVLKQKTCQTPVTDSRYTFPVRKNSTNVVKTIEMSKKKWKKKENFLKEILYSSRAQTTPVSKDLKKANPNEFPSNF